MTGDRLPSYPGPSSIARWAAACVFAFGLKMVSVFPAQAQTTPYLNFPLTADGTIPGLLSETGAFSDVGNLTVTTGIVPYQVNQPLWSDAASKLRWIAVPTGSGITFSEKEKWEFPPGTVFIKHFELGEERRRLETRFEIITAGNGSYFITYRWRSDYSDADLLDAGGLVESVALQNGRTQKWTYPSRTDCTTCHNDSANVVLGVKTRQLNLEVFDPATKTSVNQLAAFSRLELFDPPIDESAIPNLDALALITDESKSIEARVRSYLDVNCALCHNAVEPPATSAPFDLGYDTPLAQTGIVNGQVFIDLSSSGAGRVIKAQDPGGSMMYRRLASNNAQLRMPPLGRSVVDGEARDLVLQWLLGLDPIATLDVNDHDSRWTFDQTLDDESGSHDGAWRGAPAPPDFVPGRRGSAVRFDGVDDAVDAGAIDLGGSEMTLTFWFNAASLGPADATFIAKASGAAEADHFWSVSAVESSRLQFRLKTGGTTATLLSAPAALDDEKWMHVAAVYDGSEMRLYVDGAEVAGVAKSGAIDTDPNVDVAFGDLPPGAGASPLDGVMDDVRLYGRALSPGEVNSVREAALIQNEAPDVAITAPAPETYTIHGELVSFSGTAIDDEDGDIASAGVWRSSRDGIIGNGRSIQPRGLSVGRHIIVFAVNDDEVVAGSDSRTLTVVPGFATYIDGFDLFGSDANPLADTDGDGRSQLEEYAFLSSPLAGDPVPLRAFSIDDSAGGAGRRLAIEFDVWKDAIDIDYVVQYSIDLQSWTDAATYTPVGGGVTRSGTGSTIQVSGTGDGSVRRMVERDDFSRGGERGFLRLLVRQADPEV